MERKDKQRGKRTQRDYNMVFKLAVIDEVEKGNMTNKQAQDACLSNFFKDYCLVWLCSRKLVFDCVKYAVILSGKNAAIF